VGGSSELAYNVGPHPVSTSTSGLNAAPINRASGEN